jgi:hypothetical protein
LFLNKKNPISNAPVEDVEEKVRNEYQCHVDDDEHATCVMLAICHLNFKSSMRIWMLILCIS